MDRLQMAGELPHDREPVAPIAAGRAGRQGRPVDRVLGRDGGRADRVEVGDDLQQLATLTIELVAERTPDSQVIVGCRGERHVPAPASGHGRASARSAVRSTFA